jgi:acyl carrier protein
MNIDTLKHELKQLVIDECDQHIGPEALTDDEPLIGGAMGLDSLDALQISLAVKSRYGVQIEGGPEARMALASINSLAQTIIASSS